MHSPFGNPQGIHSLFLLNPHESNSLLWAFYVRLLRNLAVNNFWRQSPPRACVIFPPLTSTVMMEPGLMPSTRTCHQHGQPRLGSPAGSMRMRLASWSTFRITALPPANSAVALSPPKDGALLSATAMPIQMMVTARASAEFKRLPPVMKT